MILKKIRIAFPVAAMAAASLVLAGEDPRQERHELMEGVGDAAKSIGAMFKGETDFDAGVVMSSFGTFEDASKKLGDLFPPGSETGEGTEAAPAIWEDRAGFDAAIVKWQEAIAAAIAAAPATLEKAKPAAGAVFDACKGCHDNYRIEEEEEE
jgi:cytochrome c556